DEADMLSRREIQQEDQLLRGRLSQRPSRQTSVPIPGEPALDFENTDVEEELAESYSSMAKKESEKSVRASKEIQQLNQASNIAETQIGQSRMVYTDQNGQINNLSANIRNVQGRAFYENNNQWTDSRIQETKNKDIKWERITFNSKAYFDLIANSPEAIAYLNLGRNIRFNLGERWIEIHE
ncbi:MAG: hypothetical protein AAF598_22545, partial [Bacteroidota bacterium]